MGGEAFAGLGLSGRIAEKDDSAAMTARGRAGPVRRVLGAQ
jgi:hypothetical protein